MDLASCSNTAGRRRKGALTRGSRITVREGAGPSCQFVKGRRVRARALGREREAGRTRSPG